MLTPPYVVCRGAPFCILMNEEDGENNHKARVQALQSAGKALASQGNCKEFVNLPLVESGQECARTGAIQLDRHIQMKTAVVDNQDPLNNSLSRSINRSTIPNTPHSSGKDLLVAAADERIRNLETHLGIVFPPPDKSLFERIRAVEEKMLRIESTYPQIAAHVFNYGQAEIEASYRPKGRVSSHFPSEERAALLQQQKAKRKAPPEEGNTIELLKKRMLTLKQKLME